MKIKQNTIKEKKKKSQQNLQLNAPGLAEQTYSKQSVRLEAKYSSIICLLHLSIILFL